MRQKKKLVSKVVFVVGPAFYSGVAGGATVPTGKNSSKGKATGKAQYMVCDVCNITVTSKMMLNTHLAGRKRILTLPVTMFINSDKNKN